MLIVQFWQINKVYNTTYYIMQRINKVIIFENYVQSRTNRMER